MHYGCIVDIKDLILRFLGQKHEYCTTGPEETRHKIKTRL